MTKKTQQEKDSEIANHIIFVAQCYGWKRIEHLEEEKIILCRRNGVRVNIWYDRMTVGTAMDHPRQGSTQMIRKRVSMDMLEELLNNPRLHTTSGYMLKKGRNWGKTYRHIKQKKK